MQGLHITDVWKKYVSKQQVVVAVIDNGFAIDHPDLAGRVWSNSKEIPGNNKDDDGNGYIDDIHGYNFYEQSADITPLGDHGTQVASIIGAIANNKIGVAGISQDVALMSLVVCNSEECLHSSDLSGPIRYAVDNGADIINMSLVSKNGSFNPALDAAIKYATDNGVIVVIAAGNGQGEQDNKVGVNTTTSPLSPVCNYGDDAKRIIGV
ncbi:MAG: S8 family serine peptidase [Candidatus Peribacteria bacterium]|nr:MAG: S8 family serine peptidase [Candidatus Peribacteria bacterium]